MSDSEGAQKDPAAEQQESDEQVKTAGPTEKVDESPEGKKGEDMPDEKSGDKSEDAAKEETAAKPNDKKEAGAEVNPVFTEKKSRKKFWWSLGITLVVFTLGILVWQFKWYQPVYNTIYSGSVSIKVREGGKIAIADATVKVGDTTYTTDNVGKVSISKIVAGTYTVTVNASGYLEKSQSVTLTRGDNSMIYIDIDRKPENVYAIKGFTTDYVSGKPISDVSVTIADKTLRSDPSGAFSFTEMKAGEYKLSLSKQGYTSKEMTITLTDADSVTSSLPLVPSGRVIFVSNRDGGKRALYSSEFDGSNQAQLIAPQNGGEDYAPILAASGQYVIFSSTRDQQKNQYGSVLSQLYFVKSDGTGLKKISNDFATNSVQLSPDSRFVYYSGYSDTNQTKSIYKVYDTVKNQVIDLGEQVSMFQFNPVSSTAVYSVYESQPGSYSYSLKGIDFDTGQRKSYVDSATSYITYLMFASDGKSFSYGLTENNVYTQYSVVVATSAKTQVQAATQTSNLVYKVSPNLKLKAFVDTRDGKKDVFTVDSEGKNEQRLTNLGVVTSSVPLTWDSSSKYIIFAVTREGETAYWIVSTDGGDPKKVVDITLDNEGYPY